MDKFGIFNLLNSFLNLSNQNSTEKSEQKEQEPSAPSNFLSGLFGSEKPAEETTGEQSPAPVQKPAPTTPLQRQMLATMKSHDEIIKRVNKPK